LAEGNPALATLFGTSAETILIAVVADATNADAGEVALSAHVFIDTDGDEMMILSATIGASDFIA
jgi:ABC-type molybdate transport system ATPase subunit